VAHDEAARSDRIDNGLRALDRMLKSWPAMRYNLWKKTAMSVTSTTATNYTLSPVRPVRILSVRWKNTGGTETPMVGMTRDEYDRLPIKTTTGVPTTWYYDKQREAAKLYVWPVPASVTTETLEITYEREIEDMALDDAVDVPGEWWNAVVFGLASDLAIDYPGVANPMIDQKAATYLALAAGDDAEESVFFAGNW